MDMMMMMPMVFYNNKCVRLLWKNFDSCEDPMDTSKGGNDWYIASLLFVVALAVLMELLNYLRFLGLTKMTEDGAYWGRHELSSQLKMRMLVTLNYLVATMFAYALMLCIMSYNLGVFFVALLGLTVSHFFFTYLKLRKQS